MAVDPEMPFNREEMYLAAAAGEGVEVPPCPWSRKEAYLADIGDRLDDMDNRIAALATDISFKGGVATEDDLPSGAAVGDAYITEDTGVIYVWVGDSWVALGGTGINVVQTIGTSQTDVMSQDATCGLVYASGDHDGGYRIQIGKYANASGQRSVAIGGALAAGDATTSSGQRSVAIGEVARATANGSIAIGQGANATHAGELNIGSNNFTTYGYNNTYYRLISGVYDGQSAHDAATKGQLDARVLQNAGAPTTSTVGTVGQLLEDTTNGKLYQCTAVTPGTDPDPDTYTWTEVGSGGGGGSVTVVQTTGTSQTDVMSQNATTSMVYADPSAKTKVQIGLFASVSNNYGIAIGENAQTTADRGIAIGQGTGAHYANSISLGYGSVPTAVGVMAIGGALPYTGYNSSAYRLLTGLYDGQDVHDAATVGQLRGETILVSASVQNWTTLSGQSPYTYSNTVTITSPTIGANSIVELINGQPALFAKYGFAIGSISGQNVTLWSIGMPLNDFTFYLNIRG